MILDNHRGLDVKPRCDYSPNTSCFFKPSHHFCLSLHQRAYVCFFFLTMSVHPVQHYWVDGEVIIIIIITRSGFSRLGVCPRWFLGNVQFAVTKLFLKASVEEHIIKNYWISLCVCPVTQLVSRAADSQRCCCCYIFFLWCLMFNDLNWMLIRAPRGASHLFTIIT